MDFGHPINQCTPQQAQQQQLTIFYNGSLCVCDVTELQARAILLFASREMEEPRNYGNYNAVANSQPISPTNGQPLYSPTMTRSLQRFLQERKLRKICTSSGYRPY